MCSKFVFVFIFATTVSLHAQTKEDSLLTLLEKHPQPDTLRISLLISLAQQSWGSNPALTKQCGEAALKLALEINNTERIADAYREISRYYWSQTDYHQAIDYSLLAISEYEKCNNQHGISWCLGTIGLSHAQANNFNKSIEYQQRALVINRKIKNKQGIARNLNNLGYVFELKKDTLKALEYYKQALDMRVEIGIKSEIVMPLNNVGSIYMALGDYTQSRAYFLQSLAMAMELGNKNMMALEYQNLGEVMYKTNQYTQAKEYLNQSLVIAKEIGDKKRQEGVYEVLRNLEHGHKNFEAAYTYQQLLQTVRDTLYSLERSAQLAEMESRYEKEKQVQAIQLLERDARIKSLWNNILLAGLVVTLVFFVTLFRIQRYRENKNKEMLNLQIDLLTAQQAEMTEKYKEAILAMDEAPGESQDQQFIRKALEVVEQYIADPQFGVEKMAEEMNMSRGNLHRRLKSVSGFVPSDFIRTVRLKRAAHLLKCQTDSVAQVGFTVGFEDQSYFSKCFKKQFGISPSEFTRSMAQSA